MEPLRIVAEIPGPIALPGTPLALDALLAAQIALRDQLPPAMSDEEVVPIEIPIEREPGGRFHLASFAVGEVSQREWRYINRRFPLAEAQAVGRDIGRLRITSGPAKSYRIPMETLYLVDGRLTWWCVGERAEIEVLLGGITHVGKKRAVGLGQVRRWVVEPCVPWDDGFPLVRDGQALRTLPRGWPGLAEDVPLATVCLTYPYWIESRAELCAVAVWR